MAKKSTKRTRKAWSKQDTAALRKHSKSKTHLAVLTKLFKRTEGALRQKALNLGFGLGHQR